MDLAWMTLQSNKVGLNEFARWAKDVASEVMYAVHLGTHGPDEAHSIVKYANIPKGTYWSDLRRNHGVEIRTTSNSVASAMIWTDISRYATGRRKSTGASPQKRTRSCNRRIRQ
jgi:hypothetical protein